MSTVELIRRVSGGLLLLVGAICVGWTLWCGGAWAVADGVLLLWVGYRQGSDDIGELRQTVERIRRHYPIGPRSVERDD